MRKTLASFAALHVMLIIALPALTQDQKPTEVKCNVEYLDKTLGIKLKSATLMEVEKSTQVKMILEFTKDVDDVKQLYKTFTPGTGGSNIPQLAFYCFDADNVVLTAVPLKQVSVLTGKKGDAFSVLVDFGPVKNIKKVEVRPIEKPK
jgi:hypothetical protein